MIHATRLIRSATMVAFGLYLAACSQPSQGLASRSSKLTIGVAVPESSAWFYEQMEKGIRNRARQFGLTATVLESTSIAMQQREVDNFVSEHVAAIVLTPYDSVALDPAMAEANAARIPVITVDIASTHEEWRAYANVQSDNTGGGVAAGKLMCLATKGKGEVAILDEPEVTSVRERVSGFVKALGSDCRRVQIIADVDARSRYDQSKGNTELIIRAHPTLSGVFAINDVTAHGAIDALGSRLSGRRIALISYDGEPAAVCAEERNLIYAEIIQNPSKLGSMAVDDARHAIEQKAPRNVTIPTGIVSKKVVDSKCTMKWQE